MEKPRSLSSLENRICGLTDPPSLAIVAGAERAPWRLEGQALRPAQPGSAHKACGGGTAIPFGFGSRGTHLLTRGELWTRAR